MKRFALVVLMLAPALAEAQPLPGAGFDLTSQDRVRINAGPACPQAYNRPGGGPVDPRVDPWALLGVPVTEGPGSLNASAPVAVTCSDGTPSAECRTGRWEGQLAVGGHAIARIGQSPAGARALVLRAAWEELLADRYVPAAPNGPACRATGPAGTNHGNGCRSDLESACAAGKLAPGYDCQPNARELTDCEMSQTAYARLQSLGGNPPGGGGTQPPGSPTPCPVGWSCDPLSKLTTARRPPAAKLVRYGEVAAPVCTQASGAWTWVSDRAACWDLPPGCERDLSVPLIGVYALPVSCWEPIVAPEPEPPVEPPPPSPPSTGRMVLELCTAGQWEFTLDGQPQRVTAPGQVTVDGVSVDLPRCPEVAW